MDLLECVRDSNLKYSSSSACAVLPCKALYMALSREDCTQTDPAGPVYSNEVEGKVGLSFYLSFSLCVLEVAA